MTGRLRAARTVRADVEPIARISQETEIPLPEASASAVSLTAQEAALAAPEVDQVGSGACHTGDRTCFDAGLLHG